MGAFADGVGSYDTSQDSGPVMLFHCEEEMQEAQSSDFLSLASFLGQRKKALPTHSPPCWLPLQRASHTYLQPTGWHISRVNKAHDFSY